MSEGQQILLEAVERTRARMDSFSIDAARALAVKLLRSLQVMEQRQQAVREDLHALSTQELLARVSDNEQEAVICPPRKKRKARSCKICNQTGHDKRTCPERDAV